MVRVVFFAMIFICNGMMWTLFTKSLQFCSSTAEATVTNTASNFLVSVSNFLVSVTNFLVNVSNLITLYFPNRHITKELIELVAFMVQNCRILTTKKTLVVVLGIFLGTTWLLLIAHATLFIFKYLFNYEVLRTHLLLVLSSIAVF